MLDTQDRFALPPAPTYGILGLETPSVQNLGFRDLLAPRLASNRQSCTCVVALHHFLNIGIAAESGNQQNPGPSPTSEHTGPLRVLFVLCMRMHTRL